MAACKVLDSKLLSSCRVLWPNVGRRASQRCLSLTSSHDEPIHTHTRRTYCTNSDANKSVYVYEDVSVKLIKNYGLPESKINLKQFLKDLTATGLQEDDPRLFSTFSQLKAEQEINENTIEQDLFMQIIHGDMYLIEMALKGKFVIQEFGNMTDKIRDIYEECKGIQEGHNATYIPELANVDPALWGVSLCTVSGQRYDIGNFDSHFTIQSGGKCFSYPIAVDEVGEEMVHNYVGMEPSGGHFNKMMLNHQGKPHNPMINAGAMMLCSLIRPTEPLHLRVSYLLQQFANIAGLPKQNIKFDMVTCDSESANNDRNRGLLHYMKSKNAFPDNTSLDDTIRLYTRLCSIEMDCRRGSVMAATLANGGLCPITNKQVLSSNSVTKTLTLMHSCGMYDYSGEFGYNVGLPGKSGVSGVIFLVIPNLMGLCLYSPPVNTNGNSVRGLNFCRRLVETFQFHVYDSTRVKVNKIDPRNYKGRHKELEITSIMYGARTGALSSMQRYLMSGINLNQYDYDGRTPLHVAATHGKLNVVKFLIERAKVDPSPIDQWDNTPLHNAIQFGHQDIIEYLQQRQQDCFQSA